MASFKTSRPVGKLLPLACLAVTLVFGLQGTTTAIAQSSSDFTASQEEQIKALVREYILENPEIITEAVGVLQARQEEEQLNRQRDTLVRLMPDMVNAEDDAIIGNPDGDVTVIEFFDYNCGYCKQMLPTVIDAVREDGNIRFVLKEFPILGPTSVTASKAALASRKQGLYGPFHQALMAHKGGYNESQIMNLARGVGLDIDKLKADMDDPEIENMINRTRELAQELEINGTPAFIAGDVLIPGAISPDRFDELIAQARNKG